MPAPNLLDVLAPGSTQPLGLARLQHFLGHTSITNTVRYTAMSPEPFKDTSGADSNAPVTLCGCVMSNCVVLWPLIALAGWVFGNLALLGAMAAFDWWHTRRRYRLRQRRLSSRAERRLGEIMAEQPRQGLGEQWEKKPGIENPVPSLAEQGIDKNVKPDLCAELMCLLTSLASATA